MKYKAWLPDNGNDESDAVEYEAFDPEHAAEQMCQDHWDRFDGWESGFNVDFNIVVKSPDGKITKFKGEHEESVEHNVSEIEETEGAL